VRQLEEEAQQRLHTIAGEIFEQFQGDYNKSIERIELVLKVLEEAEAKIAALYDHAEAHDGHEAAPRGGQRSAEFQFRGGQFDRHRQDDDRAVCPGPLFGRR
jgi:hypothetical protein